MNVTSMPGRVLTTVTLVLTIAGCKTADQPTQKTVQQAWSASASAPVVAAPPTAFTPTASQAGDNPIAIVDGRPISRERVVNLLLAAGGAGVLEQLIVLDAAERMLAERNMSVSDAEVQAEYDRSLQKLRGDAAEGDSPKLQREAAEAILNEMLSSRNLSRQEFMIVTRRNAILRKIVDADTHFSEEQLRQEHARLYGERVEIQHIQLETLQDAERVIQQRKAGVDFAELALRYSVNRASAEQGGLLPPFGAQDTDVPPLLQKTAFALKPGEESKPLAVDGWYQIIRVNRRIPARLVSFNQARDEVERQLRQRLADAAMQALYADLFKNAKIEIVDPAFREMFFQKHADHQSAPK